MTRLLRASGLLLVALLCLAVGGACDAFRLSTPGQTTTPVPCISGVYFGQHLKSFTASRPKARFEASFNGYVENFGADACGFARASYYFKRRRLRRVVMTTPESRIGSIDNIEKQIHSLVDSPSAFLGKPNEASIYFPPAGGANLLPLVAFTWEHPAWNATLFFPSREAARRIKEENIHWDSIRYTLHVEDRSTSDGVWGRVKLIKDHELAKAYRKEFIEKP